MVTSDATGVTLMIVRNGLLVAATLVAARRLWRRTVTEPGRPEQPVPVRPVPYRGSAPAGDVSRDGTADTPASAP